MSSEGGLRRWWRCAPSLAVVLVLLVGALGLRPATAEPRADAARTLVEEVSTEVLAILSNSGLSQRQKYDQLVALLSGPIDLDLVARLILGRYWRAASAEQQAEYLELFRDYALANLASKLDVYQGERFEVTGAKEVGKRDALVSSQILTAGQPPIKIDWRIRQRKDDNLVAIDVIVEGVSLVITQRSEFAAVIERQGIDGLLAELRQRVQSAA